MPHDHALDSLVERICRQWDARRLSKKSQPPAPGGIPPRFTIAIERQAGVLGTSIARAIGQRLGWQVYDHELLERIAQEMGLRASLLQSVDEHHASWLREVSDHLMLLPSVSDNAYIQHLVGTVLALGAHGECIIVGRGASQVLPPETTLRVRLVAPREHRLATIRQQQGVTEAGARKRLKAVDRERIAFVKGSFHKDPTDPANYDVLLNTARFPLDQTVDLIVEALQRLQVRAAVPQARLVEAVR